MHLTFSDRGSTLLKICPPLKTWRCNPASLTLVRFLFSFLVIFFYIVILCTFYHWIFSSGIHIQMLPSCFNGRYCKIHENNRDLHNEDSEGDAQLHKPSNACSTHKMWFCCWNQGRLIINNRYAHREFKLKFSALLKDYDLKICRK